MILFLGLNKENITLKLSHPYMYDEEAGFIRISLAERIQFEGKYLICNIIGEIEHMTNPLNYEYSISTWFYLLEKDLDYPYLYWLPIIGYYNIYGTAQEYEVSWWVLIKSNHGHRYFFFTWKYDNTHKFTREFSLPYTNPPPWLYFSIRYRAYNLSGFDPIVGNVQATVYDRYENIFSADVQTPSPSFVDVGNGAQIGHLDNGGTYSNPVRGILYKIQFYNYFHDGNPGSTINDFRNSKKQFFYYLFDFEDRSREDNINGLFKR